MSFRFQASNYRFQVSSFRMRDKNGGFIGKKSEIIVFFDTFFWTKTPLFIGYVKKMCAKVKKAKRNKINVTFRKEIKTKNLDNIKDIS